MKAVYASWCFTIKPCSAIKYIKSVKELEWCIKFMHNLRIISQSCKNVEMRHAYPDIYIVIPPQVHREWDTKIVVITM